MARSVAVVAHTHWDREWYVGFSSFRVRLVEVLSSLLDRLEADPRLRHVLLDGQMALVDDYLAARPEDEARLRALVGAGRVSVGPWYVLMDEFLVSGETIVRNLQRGVARARDFGGHLPVGYLPDMFGHVAQMPQLLRLAGIGHAVVWRGVPSSVERTGFWWRAPDGTTVRAEYLPAGYSNGAAMPDDAGAVLRRLRAHEAQLEPFLLPSAALLVMNGTDHQPPDPWLSKVVDEVNSSQDHFDVEITSLAEHLAGAPTESLPSWTGELRSSARANLLPGVASNHVDVKVAAAVAERSLERLAEPLAALWLPAERWPGGILDEAWLQVIRSAAHDSICACSADEVALAVRHRYAEATLAAEELVASVLREATGAFHFRGSVVVNPNPTAAGGLVEVVVPGEPPPGTQALEVTPEGVVERDGLGRDLPCLLGELTEEGWLQDAVGTSAAVAATDERVELVIGVDAAAPPDRTLRSVGPSMAEAAAQAAAHADQPLHVRVERRATSRVLARVASVPGYGWTALNLAYSGEGTPVRGGESWLDNGLVHLTVSSADGTFAINDLAGFDRLVDGGDEGDTYNYSPPGHDLLVSRPDEVAVSLLEDGPLRGRLSVRRRYTWPSHVEAGRRVGAEDVTVTTLLELRAAEPLVYVTTSWDNRARDHRLRTHFPLVERAERSEAECAFGTVTRGRSAEGGIRERGMATFPSRRFVQAGGVTVTHEGLLEYELVDDGWCLALTLLRATGVISRPAPAYRPNPAGPATPAPSAQLPGPIRVRYAVAVGPVDPWRCAELAWVPLQVVTSVGGGSLPERGSRLRIRGGEVSSLRRGADGALELRVFNPSDEAAAVDLEGWRGWIVGLTGQPVREWSETFLLRPREIATARLQPAEV